MQLKCPIPSTTASRFPVIDFSYFKKGVIFHSFEYPKHVSFSCPVFPQEETLFFFWEKTTETISRPTAAFNFYTSRVLNHNCHHFLFPTNKIIIIDSSPVGESKKKRMMASTDRDVPAFFGFQKELVGSLGTNCHSSANEPDAFLIGHGASKNETLSN